MLIQGGRLEAGQLAWRTVTVVYVDSSMPGGQVSVSVSKVGNAA